MAQSGRWIPVRAATYCLHLGDIPKMKALCFTEMFVTKYQTIRCYNIENAHIKTANVSLLILNFILYVTCWSSFERNVCDGIVKRILRIIIL